jgi:hypothetical protein
MVPISSQDGGLAREIMTNDSLQGARGRVDGLRNYAKRGKISGSSPVKVIVLLSINLTLSALGVTKLLTEISTRNFPGG